MRAIFISFILILPLKVSCQNDTIIYFSGLNKSIISGTDASFCYKLRKKSENNFVLINYLRKDHKWIEIDYYAIRKESDSSFTLFQGIPDALITNRVFEKSNSGYFIKDYTVDILLREGYSKLIFPLIKTGYWREYDRTTGKISTEGHYDENQLINNIYWINDSVFIPDVHIYVDKDPQYEGGNSEFLEFIEENLEYPLHARVNKIAGTVLVNCIIMTDGSLRNIKIAKRVDEQLDNEALRVIRSAPDKWIPAQIGNKKVNVPMVIPVTFRLN